jgi:hypothetical protein
MTIIGAIRVRHDKLNQSADFLRDLVDCLLDSRSSGLDKASEHAVAALQSKMDCLADKTG